VTIASSLNALAYRLPQEEAPCVPAAALVAPFSCRSGSRVGRLLLSALLCAVWSPLLASISAPVRTDTGLVSGSVGRDESISVYKGIPYAAPPVGALRWKPPQPSAPWHGERKADHFSDACAQPAPRNNAALKMSEDCLYLNVWTGARSRSARRPVMVWIYGGGFMLGSASQPSFDGEGLARKGLVVVTLNYRLGPFGFLATPELSRESGRNVSGNYGLLDMIAALKWVHRNIAGFGGDPARVTIAGQSSGAGSALLLAQSPQAMDLFRGAIAQSGARAIGDPTFVQTRSLASTERRGVRFAEARGAHSLQQLRALQWQQLLEGVELDKADPGEDGDASLPVFRPAIDGWVLPLSTRETYARGLQQDIPVMTGFNLDEMGAEPHPGFTLAALHQSAQQNYGPMAAELLRLYPAPNDEQSGQVQRTFSRDRSRASSYLWATEWKQKAHSNVYLYFWTHAPPGPRGAAHGAELPFAFNSLDVVDSPWTEQDRKAAEMMSSYWANFVVKGDPNGPGLPRWPAFDGAPEIMVLGEGDGTMAVAEPGKLDFMRRFFAAQKPW
jgi:para-nitrobenzyl esterase